jgi:ABC-2 type transport system ATP-binding protein
MQALQVHQITKTFKKEKSGTVTALDTVSLSVEEGKIYGLLGPNGAGKSTLISIISGILTPTSGQVQLFGHDVARDTIRTKSFMGIVPQEVVVEAAFTVKEVLYYFSGMYGVPVGEREKRIKDILEDLSLTDKMNEKARSLSGGMKRRLMIAKALLHRPKLVILDEPTAGVDVALRQKIWELVRRLNQEGTTILFTTHYLEEAEQLCEEITVINHGKVIKQGNLAAIQKEFSKSMIHFELFNQNVEQLSGVKKNGTVFEFPIIQLSNDMNKVIQFYGDNLKSIKNEAASLEQIFLELTSNKN